MAETLLEATGLSVAYPSPDGTIEAVRDLSLSIREHEFVGLVGESGSGKSTAALALIGLVRAPGEVTAGSVHFQGQSLLDRSEAQLRAIRGRDIGLIVQSARAALNPLIPVGDQIVNVIRAHQDVSRSEARRRAVAALAAVDIPDPSRRAHAYPHQLSGGLAQRVLIAMATVNEPRLLIADEPTTGLDVTVQAQFLDTLQASVQRTGSAVLFVTHDLGIVAQYCHRVAVMYQGRIVEQGDVSQIFVDPAHDYARQLVGLAAERDRALVSARDT